MPQSAHFLIALFFSFLIIACQPVAKPTEHVNAEEKQQVDSVFPPVVNINQLKQTAMVATLESKLPQDKNAIYASSLLYAWEKVGVLLGGKILVKEADTSEFYLINNSRSYLKTLNAYEYSAEAHREGDAFVATSSFNKALPFMVEMQKIDQTSFNNQPVKAFGIQYYNDEVARAVRILYYKDDNNFIVSLWCLDEGHEMYLYKSSTYKSTMAMLYKQMRGLISKGFEKKRRIDEEWKFKFTEDDKLIIPELRFNILANYSNIAGHTFYCKDSEHILQEARQSIAFVLNEKGTVLDSKAYAAGDSAVAPGAEKPHPKNLVFNGPFAIFLQRKNADNPYFAMMVNNPELMVKKP